MRMSSPATPSGETRVTRFRKRLTYANVMSTLAVFLVLSSGAAYATHLVVKSGDVVDDTLVSRDLKNNRAVRGADVVNGTLSGGDIGDGRLTGADVGDGTLSGGDVTDGTISGADVGDDSLTGVDVGDGTLGGADVGDGSLSGADVEDGTLTGGDVEDGILTGEDVMNESLSGPDIADNTLTRHELDDNTLTGAEIDESTLSSVPMATLGGLGRSAGGGTCDPESATYVECRTVAITLADPARVLLIATVIAKPESSAERAVGYCRLARSPGGAISGTDIGIATANNDGVQFHVSGAMTTVTPTLSAGTVTFIVECSQEPTIGAIQYESVQISAVALSSA